MLDDYDLPAAGNIARKKTTALVFLKSDSGEAYISVDGNIGDRYAFFSSKSLEGRIDLWCDFGINSKNLTAWAYGDDLVLAVAAQNNNTIVVVNSVGPLILEPWIDHPNVTAVRLFLTPSLYLTPSFLTGCLGWSSGPRIWQLSC